MIVVLLFLLFISGPAASEGFIVSWSMPDSIETNYDLGIYYFIIESQSEGVINFDTLHAPIVRDRTDAGRVYFNTIAGADSARYYFWIYTFIPSNPEGLRISNPAGSVSGLILNWSQAADVTLLKERGNDIDVLYVLLPYGPWNLQWLTISPDTVTAWFEYDFVMDGFINLSDLSMFANGYGSIYGLPEFTMFGGMWQKQALLVYEGGSQ